MPFYLGFDRDTMNNELIVRGSHSVYNQLSKCRQIIIRCYLCSKMKCHLPIHSLAGRIHAPSLSGWSLPIPSYLRNQL